jgi:hypothetical protein
MQSCSLFLNSFLIVLPYLPCLNQHILNAFLNVGYECNFLLL